MGRIICSPALGEKRTINFENNQDLLIHLCAFEADNDEQKFNDLAFESETFLLQCWTNLPIINKIESSQWHAINLGQWPPKKKRKLISTYINIDTREIVDSNIRHRRQTTFELTWRLINIRTTEVRWLGLPDQNVKICFQSKACDFGYRCLETSPDVRIMAKDSYVTTYSLEIQHDKSVHGILQVKGELIGGLSIEHTKPTWHTTRHIQSFYDISEQFDSSLIVLKFTESHSSKTLLSGEEGGSVYVIRAISGPGMICSLRRCGDMIDLITVQDTNNSLQKEARSVQFLVAQGNPDYLHSLIRTTSSAAKSLLARQELQISSNPVAGDFGLGLCTWEAFGAGKHPLYLDSVIDWIGKAMESDAFKSILLDDGWQDIIPDSNRPGRGTLNSFGFNPHLLKETMQNSTTECSNVQIFTSKVRSKFPQVKQIGVWMTLAGYWDGLNGDPSSFFSIHYGPLVRVKLRCPLRHPMEQQIQEWYIPPPERLQDFWNDCFSSLSKVGITFVKIDDQADWEWFENTNGIKGISYYEKAWFAMQKAAEKYFGSSDKVIHCMAMGKKMDSFLLTNSSNKIRIRSSDDTFPNIPQAHTWHIYHNAIQASLTSSIEGVECDADMVTTTMQGEQDEDWASFHVAFRMCFSSAPLWISDNVENMKNERFLKMLAKVVAPVKSYSIEYRQPVQLPEGKTSLPLTTSAFINLTDPFSGPALKMGCCGPLSKGGSANAGILSLWNVRSDRNLAFDFITVRDVAETIDGMGDGIVPQNYFLFNNSSMLCTFIQDFVDFQTDLKVDPICSRPLVPIFLQPSGWQIWSISPSFSLSLSSTRQIQISCVGLLDKFVGICAVGQTCIISQNNIFETNLHHAGQCGILIRTKKINFSNNVSIDELMVDIDGSTVHSENISCQRLEADDDEIVQQKLLVINMVSHLNQIQSQNLVVDDTKTWRVRIRFNLDSCI